MEIDDLSHKQWLSDNDVSRPHRTSRWRVRSVDTRCVNFLPHFLEVGGFFSETPAMADYEHFCKWRDSDERRYKQNASGFLRFAKYRHLVDGEDKNQVHRVRKMCGDIRKAMIAFSQGDSTTGESSMHDAWCSYVLLALLSTSKLTRKGAVFAPGRRKGAKGSFRKLVENAHRETDDKSWKGVIKKLESDTSRVQEVDWDGEKIWIDGESSPKKFKTVRNIIAKL